MTQMLRNLWKSLNEQFFPFPSFDCSFPAQRKLGESWYLPEKLNIEGGEREWLSAMLGIRTEKWMHGVKSNVVAFAWIEWLHFS